MGVAWARVGIVLLALAVALPSATVFAQQGGEGGPIPERQTTCWPCHVDWPPPLKTFYNLLPPAEAGAEVGQPFAFVVQLQNVWTPPKDGPYILYYEPALDLTAAPSLGFFSDTPPKHEDRIGTIPASDPQAPTTRQSGFVVTDVPAGATKLSIVLRPADANTVTGPDLVLKVYPGMTAPAGDPAMPPQDGTGRGQAETLTLEGLEAFRGFGYGNWTIQAEAKAVEPDPADPTGLLNPPSAGPQAFTVTVDAAVEDTGERIQVQPIRKSISKGGSDLFKYQLRASGPPAAGEFVRLVVNATVHYKHDDAGTDNYANVTKAYPADIPVTFEDPMVALRTVVDSSTVVVGADLGNGPTMDTILEAVGYAAAFLLVSSVWTGGMFGKASRRSLNTVFGSAKRRVAFHNFLSYGLTLAAAVHTVLFIIKPIEPAYHWTLGLIWGGIALLAMLLLGITGAFQVQMIRRWNYGTWRWSHYALAVLAIAFTLVHMALDGVHFASVQEALGWDDPLDTRATG